MDYDNLRGASSEAISLLENFWPRIMREIQNFQPADFKNPELPLARIKKIMKLDEEVKMISAEAPIIFAKAAEIFIQEVTIRAWLHTEENKRRTLQRNDVALAVSKYDQFDFLIDIVPREEIKPASSKSSSSSKETANQSTNASHHSPQQQVIQTPATIINQQIPMGATILDAQTASLLLNGGAATAAAPNGTGQVQYILAMAPNGAVANGAQLQTIQGLPATAIQGIQGIPAGAQIILNQNGQPTIFMGNRTDC